MAIFFLKLTTVILVLGIASGKEIRPFLKKDFLIPSSGWMRSDRPYFKDGLPSDGPPSKALHHIVPYSTLRNFYNAVLERAIPAEVNQLGVGLRNVLQRLNKPKTFFDEFEREALKDASITPAAMAFCDMLANYRDTTDADMWPPSKKKQITDGFDQLIEFYSWPPGNLFIGPAGNVRSDDPGDAFEVESCRLVAPELYALLLTMDALMVKFYEERAGPGNLKLVTNVANKLDEIAARHPIIYKYDESKWILNGDKYSIAKSDKRRCPSASEVQYAGA